MLDALWTDLGHATRRLVRRPGFTLIALLTLALGIGAALSVFTVVHSVLLQPLPYAEPDRLVMVWLDNKPLEIPEDVAAYATYLQWEEQSDSFTSLAAAGYAGFNLSGDGAEPQRVESSLVSANFFDTLGVRPVVGRTFVPGENEPGAANVVVLSETLWRTRYGADPQIDQRSVDVDGEAHRIVGVVPSTVDLPPDVDLWAPIVADEGLRTRFGRLWLRVIGRLAPGVSVEQAQAEMDTVAAALEAERPEVRMGFAANLEPLREEVIGDAASSLWVLLAAVLVLLGIACVNVANLMLAETSLRERETALMAALGASSGGLVRRLLVESLLLGLVGAGAGLLLASVVSRAFVALGPPGLPRTDEVSVDPVVGLVALLLVLATTVLVGLVPALRASRPSFGTLLKEGTAGAGRSLGASRLQRLLMGAEVALAVVLLVGAGLLADSLRRLNQVDLGFETGRAATLRVDLPLSRYLGDGGEQRLASFKNRLIERIEALPGVESASHGSALFRGTGYRSVTFAIEGRPPQERETLPEVVFQPVGTDFFRTLGIPLLAGRDVTDRDWVNGQPVVVIDEVLAERYFPDENPLGQRIRYGRYDTGGPWMEIVGVVGSIRSEGPRQPAPPATYVPHQQMGYLSTFVVARTSVEPESLFPALRQAVREVDPLQPVTAMASLEDVVDEQTADQRFYTALLTAFAVAALLLAMVGVYGVVAFGVGQSLREMGIRLALGASGRHVVGLVVGRAVTVALVGAAVGALAAAFLARWLGDLLYGTRPLELWVYLVLALAMVAVAALASLLPARRAAAVDPARTLREA